MKTIWILVAALGCADDVTLPPDTDSVMPDMGDDIGVDMSGDASCEPPDGNLQFDFFIVGCKGLEDVRVQTVPMWNMGESPIIVETISTWSEPEGEFRAAACRDPPFDIPPCEVCDLTVSWTPTPESNGDITLGGVIINVREEVDIEIQLCALNGLCPWEQGLCGP